MNFLTIVVCFAIFAISRVQSMGMLGPANYIFKLIEECPDAPHGIAVSVSGRKVDRVNFGLTIEVDSPYDFDGDVGMIIIGSQQLDGGYKETFHWNDSDACKCMETFLGDVFEDLRQKANITDGCPFPKGHYRVDDWIFDNEKFTTHTIYGLYRVEMKLTYKGVDQCCVIVYLEIVAKDKLA